MGAVNQEVSNPLRFLQDCMGSAADILRTMISKPVVIAVSGFEYIHSSVLFHKSDSFQVNDEIVMVQMYFKGSCGGFIAFLVPLEEAEQLAGIILGKAGNTIPQTSKVRTDILMEVGNIILNAVMGNAGKHIKNKPAYTIPEYYEGVARSLIPANIISSSKALTRARLSLNCCGIEFNAMLVTLIDKQIYEVLGRKAETGLMADTL